MRSKGTAPEETAMTPPKGHDQGPPHLRGLVRHFAGLHNPAFRADFRIVPATVRGNIR
jgi:hypothetical protein